MSDFVKVFGKDPHYKVTDTPMYIAIHTIVKVYPVFGVRDETAEERTFYRCHAGHEKAELVTHKILTHDGEEYTLPIGDGPLQALGIKDMKTNDIGFKIKEREEDLPEDQ